MLVPPTLVSDDARMAAEQMEELIVEAKGKAENAAVSSIIKRYDNKVQHSHILGFNHLVQELCKKHNITFTENEFEFEIWKYIFNLLKSFYEVIDVRFLNKFYNI